MEQESLKSKTVKGIGWSFADNISGSGISFLVGLVLARLLTPNEYGLIGIITIFIAVFNSIVDSGFSNALIRKKNAGNIDYNTVFTFNLLLSIALFRVMSIIIVINAFAIIQRTILVRKVDFKTQTKVSFIASMTSGVIGIGMAIGECGVWSLVGQQISRQLLNTLFLWVFNTWRPVLQFSIKSFRELFSFGWKLLVSSLIDTVWKEIYQVVIGKYYTTESLGQYTRAKQFCDIFSSNLTSVVQRVSYPVLSTIQGERERLKQAYKRVIKTTMLITFVCMLGLAAMAKSIILVLIGEQWLPAVVYLQIICFSAMFYPLHAINLNMLQVNGRSDLFLKLEVVKKVIAVGPLLLGIFVHVIWMLWGSVLVGFVSYYLNSYYSGRDLNYGIREQIKNIAPSFFIAGLMAIVVYALSFVPVSVFILLPVQLLVGTSVVVVVGEISKIEEYIEVKQIALSVIRKITSR